MTFNTSLGFSWSLPLTDYIFPASDPRKPKFMLRKMLAQYVWDIAQLEDNPFTFVDVQTLLDGITVAGYSVQDHNQIINQAKALKSLLSLLDAPKKDLQKQLTLDLHSHVACEEALAWGVFRDGQVGISGTSHTPPRHEDLDEIFSNGITTIKYIVNPVEQALIYFLWASMNQFFYDGNKRTGRLVMNYILMSNNFYYLSVPADRKEDFNSLMVDFYNSKNADKVISFLLDCYKNWD